MEVALISAVTLIIALLQALRGAYGQNYEDKTEFLTDKLKAEQRILELEHQLDAVTITSQAAVDEMVRVVPYEKKYEALKIAVVKVVPRESLGAIKKEYQSLYKTMQN